MRKFWVVSGAVVMAVVLYNLDAITGQWKFERMCEKESGTRFFGMVEKDVGWEVDAGGIYDYREPFQFGHVAFVRFRDQSGVLVDARESGYEHIAQGTVRQRAYSISPADENKRVRYRLRYASTTLPEDKRFGRTDTQVVDVDTGKLLASHTTFGYQWAKSERVILSAPTGQTCGYEQFSEFREGLFNSWSKP